MPPPDGPSYEDACALRLRAGACMVSDQANLAILTAVAALEMHVPVSVGEESDPRSQELQHLDNKLNVLIQLFAGFWRQQCDLPAPVVVTVSAAGLRFDRAALALPEETPRSVELYLNDALPQPLVLPVATLAALDDGRCELLFEPLSDELTDALARHIFRRHRRALAQTRQASSMHAATE